MESQKDKIISLILISFLGLFLELALIRWLPANIMSLAYFANLVLISSFFGLGIGCLVAHRIRDLFYWFPAILLTALSLFVVLGRFEVIVPFAQAEWIWLSQVSDSWTGHGWRLGVFPMIIMVYILNTSLFAVIGQKVGLVMSEFKGHPLRAYGLDLVGSIAGILAFGLLVFGMGSWNAPIIWFMAGGFISLWFLRRRLPMLILGAACILGIFLVIQFFSNTGLWSPYYKINISESEKGSLNVYVNNFFHQRAVDFNQEKKIKDQYSLPYKLKKPKDVLILGAGTGNDVAVAKLNGAERVDAVEIDPMIAELGLNRHPNDPYSLSGVNIFIDDARSFLKKNDKKYDMVVLGTLDSHALLSAMSTVRLDNFIYTREALEDIRRNLKDDGIVVLMFYISRGWLFEKLIETVSVVFDDSPPLALHTESLFNVMMIAGPGLDSSWAERGVDKNLFTEMVSSRFDVDIPTDDWPYLYLAEKSVPGHYLKIVAMLMAISILSILFAMPKRKEFDMEGLNFFCLGSAFLLLEAKSITTLSLLFGSTWTVNAFVFGAILTMILTANILVSKYKINNLSIIYVLLMSALIFNFFLPENYFLEKGFWFRSLLSSGVVALPIFFAAIIFSSHFRKVGDISSLYGMNLMGAVFGGFLEYSSMAIGLNNLYIVAGSFYLASFLIFWAGPKLINRP